MPSGLGLWGMIMGGLIYAEFRRIIKGFHFLIIGAITLAVMLILALIGTLNLGVGALLFIAFMSGAGMIAITALFRLIYLLLSKLL